MRPPGSYPAGHHRPDRGHQGPQDVLHRIADETRRLLGCDAVLLMLMDDD